MAATTTKPYRIGVLLESVQLTDIVGIDIFGNLSKEYILAAAELDASVAALAPLGIEELKVYYMGPTLEPVELTAQFRYAPNVTYDDCPRDLDLVLVGGNTPGVRPEAASRFMREAWRRTPVWMTTCTGALWLADAVGLDGRRATTNRMALPLARKMHPGVEWADLRWVVDSKTFEGEGEGELWTSGGAGAGLDMIADYCLKHWDPRLVKPFGLYGIELQPGRSFDQHYNYDMAEVWS
ncbi:hypothetical protein RB597_007044 [Gaeumannomyces tritici]